MQLSTTASGCCPLAVACICRPKSRVSRWPVRKRSLPSWRIRKTRRVELPLQFAGGIVDVLDIVFQLILFTKPAQADLHAANWCVQFFELANQAENIRIDVVGAAGVEQHVAATWCLAQSLVDSPPIEKADLIGQLDMQHVAAQMLFDDPP